MNSFKNMSRRKLWHEIKRRLQSSAAPSNGEFVIPARIERGPTDILKALESTIKRDQTAPHYKFHDDPFLTPLSKLQSRTYAMARESGRKTAMWIHKEHGDLFQKDLSEPQIKAFLPPIVYDDNSKVSEEILLDLVSQGNVADALDVYKLLNSEVSNETKQALLELLCFYNGEHVMKDDLPEERWHQRIHGVVRNTWRNNPEITKLFEHLIKQDSPAVVAAAYNALLCGVAKHHDLDASWDLYMECKKNNIPLTLEAYNYLIRLVPLFRGGNSKPQELVIRFFSDMAAAGLHPTVNILNGALHVASKIQSPTVAIQFTRAILGEFKRLKIEFSLASYYHILCAYSREGNSSATEFVDVINALPEESFPLRDPDDARFFVKAMWTASQQYCDRYAGERLHSILLTGDNYKFLADSFSESTYFREYMILTLATSTTQEFFEIYRKLVPHIYIPEPSLMADILKSLEPHKPEIVTEYLRELWSDIIIFGHLDRDNVITVALHLMRTACDLPPDSPIHQTFADAGWTIWTNVQENNAKRRQTITLDGNTLGDVLVLLLRDNRVDQMMEILKDMMDDKNVQIGVMNKEQVNEIFETCMSQGLAMEALLLLEYCLKNDFDNVSEMATKLHDCLAINNVLRSKLINLVGADMIETQESPKNNT